MSYKRVLACIMVLCFALSIFPLQPAKAPCSSIQTAATSVDDVDWWPMFHHDLTHTGTSTSTGPTTNNTLWNYTTGDRVYSSPAVVGDLVYVGSGDGNVYCLNATTGSLVWSYTTSGWVVSSPAVVGGFVYVGSYDAKVYCLNATTGSLVWSYTTSNWVYSSPAVVNEVVYVGSTDGKIYAFGPVHNVAVTNVASSKTVVGQGFSATINVTVANQGDYTETFNVTAYANATVIGSENVTLPAGNSTTLTFTWNTADFAFGNHTISAYASPVEGETLTEDNTLVDGWVFVTILGDVNGDKRVNILDCILIANHFGHAGGDGHTPGSKEWFDCANCDINSDTKTNVLDCIILSNHFGQSWS